MNKGKDISGVGLWDNFKIKSEIIGIFFDHGLILREVKLRVFEIDGILEEFENALEFAGVDGDEKVEKVEGIGEGFGLSFGLGYDLVFDLVDGLRDGLAFDFVHDWVLWDLASDFIS